MIMNRLLFDGPKFDSNDSGDAALVDPHVPNRSRAQGEDVEGRDRLTNAEMLEIDHPQTVSVELSAKDIAMRAAQRIKPEEPFSYRNLPSGSDGLAEDRARALGRTTDDE